MVKALSERFLGGSGYAYGIVGESVHMLINANEANDSSLLLDGL